MNDIVSINRQFLIMARQLANSKSESGEIVTGLPRPVLERLANLSLDQIEAIAERIGISLITIRLNEAELARLASLQDGQRAAYSLAVVASGSR
ncbi:MULTISPECIES: flagellar transcriptional regulator FlhD [Tepidiphilus]|jgi:flagellar transcriptional activator FlhD|uniref:Flagellar transcriptional activator (FlhD) n=1 Tax=Tepidiphilus thermophilus TaxID=876478 RepID=A0A0K6IY12_9PROT|nr:MULTISPECIES: flagellar transcriptional regulator FlhD [Tepidiphilus]CUB08006.1 Flagellar transcriptional activator (FlhD) [Tepidiphilus thermophilus]